MKKILVATDLSETASNAVDYAFQFAKQYNYSITLLHIFHIPVPTGEMQFVALTANDIEDDAKKQLEILKRKYANAGIEVKTIVKPGFAVEEIARAGKKENYDLIITGISGSSRLSDLIIGSTATSLLHEAKCPVLIIPKYAKFKLINNMAFACDYKHIASSEVLKKIQKFVSDFNCKLSVIDVIKPAKVPDLTEAIAGVKLDRSLENINHELFFPQNKNILEGLTNFIDSHQADLMVMFPHHHTIIDRILQKSKSKRMAFNAHLPVLCINE